MSAGPASDPEPTVARALSHFKYGDPFHLPGPSTVQFTGTLLNPARIPDRTTNIMAPVPESERTTLRAYRADDPSKPRFIELAANQSLQLAFSRRPLEIEGLFVKLGSLYDHLATPGAAVVGPFGNVGVEVFSAKQWANLDSRIRDDGTSVLYWPHYEHRNGELNVLLYCLLQDDYRYISNNGVAVRDAFRYPGGASRLRVVILRPEQEVLSSVGAEGAAPLGEHRMQIGIGGADLSVQACAMLMRHLLPELGLGPREMELCHFGSRLNYAYMPMRTLVTPKSDPLDRGQEYYGVKMPDTVQRRVTPTDSKPDLPLEAAHDQPQAFKPDPSAGLPAVVKPGRGFVTLGWGTNEWVKTQTQQAALPVAEMPNVGPFGARPATRTHEPLRTFHGLDLQEGYAVPSFRVQDCLDLFCKALVLCVPASGAPHTKEFGTTGEEHQDLFHSWPCFFRQVRHGAAQFDPEDFDSDEEDRTRAETDKWQQVGRPYRLVSICAHHCCRAGLNKQMDLFLLGPHVCLNSVLFVDGFIPLHQSVQDALHVPSASTAAAASARSASPSAATRRVTTPYFFTDTHSSGLAQNVANNRMAFRREHSHWVSWAYLTNTAPLDFVFGTRSAKDFAAAGCLGASVILLPTEEFLPPPQRTSVHLDYQGRDPSGRLEKFNGGRVQFEMYEYNQFCNPSNTSPLFGLFYQPEFAEPPEDDEDDGFFDRPSKRIKWPSVVNYHSLEQTVKPAVASNGDVFVRGLDELLVLEARVRNVYQTIVGDINAKASQPGGQAEAEQAAKAVNTLEHSPSFAEWGRWTQRYQVQLTSDTEQQPNPYGDERGPATALFAPAMSTLSVSPKLQAHCSNLQPFSLSSPSSSVPQATFTSSDEMAQMELKYSSSVSLSLC